MITLGELRVPLRSDLYHMCHPCRIILKVGNTCPVCKDNISKYRVAPEMVGTHSVVCDYSKFRVLENFDDPKAKQLKPINVCNGCGKFGVAKWKVSYRFSSNYFSKHCDVCKTKLEKEEIVRFDHVPLELDDFDMI